MWNRIFIGLLVACVGVMAFLTYYALSWLYSIGSPIDARAGFERFYNYGGTFLIVSSLLLLILANAVIWQIRKSWALWSTLLYFVFFLMLRSLWLTSAHLNFLEQKFIGEETGGRGFTVLVAIVVTIAAAAFVYFDELLVVRMNERIYPPIEPNIDDPTPAFEPAEETEEFVSPPK